MWTYEFFTDKKEQEPVKDFLLAVVKKHRGKILQSIQLLAEYGPTLPFPYSSQIEGKLRELRTHYGKILYRILYYQDSKGVFILLHVFLKNTKKTPQKEINIAVKRMKEHKNKSS